MSEPRHTTEVVIYRNGRLVEGAKVVLEFSGFMSGGLTKEFRTDSRGVARVSHASEGEAKVYVDGDHSSHRTTGRAPGRILVYL